MKHQSGDGDLDLRAFSSLRTVMSRARRSCTSASKHPAATQRNIGRQTISHGGKSFGINRHGASNAHSASLMVPGYGFRFAVGRRMNSSRWSLPRGRSVTKGHYIVQDDSARG